MTSFNTLFNRMFQEKSRSVYLVFLIQVFASLCFTLLVLFSSKNDANQISLGSNSETVNGITVFFVLFAGMMAMTSFFASFVYWIISSIKNEKINCSQTWRLIPINDTKFLLSNFGTAFLSYIWLGILQVVVAGLSLLPLLSSNQIRHEISLLKINFSAQDLWQIFGGVILVILLGYAWYALVSLINLSTRSIMDFLPNGSSKALMFVVRLVIIIAIIWFLSYATTALFGIFGKFMSFIGGSNDNVQIGLVLLEFLIFDVIVTLIDVLLLNKFVEAKQN